MSYENVTSNKHSGMTKAKPVEDMMQTPNLKVRSLQRGRLRQSLNIQDHALPIKALQVQTEQDTLRQLKSNVQIHKDSEKIGLLADSAVGCHMVESSASKFDHAKLHSPTQYVVQQGMYMSTRAWLPGHVCRGMTLSTRACLCHRAACTCHCPWL